MSIIKANKWQNVNGTSYNSIIQVVSASDITYRSVSVSGGSTTDWVSVSISRLLPNSKLLVMFTGGYGTSNANDTAVRLVSNMDGRLGEGNVGGSRNMAIWSPGTDKGYGQTAGAGTYSILPAAFTYLYAPSSSGTSSITLTVQIWVEASSTVYPNGDGWRGGDTQAHNVGSHITVMEIAQ